MKLCNLDFLFAISALYLISFAWQLITHLLRFLMIKYYNDHGYYFIPLSTGAGGRKFFGVSVQQSMGLKELGLSCHSSKSFQLSWVVDIFYYLSVFTFPIYTLSLSKKYLSCHNYEPSDTLQNILQGGAAGESFLLLMFWVVFCGIFPNIWGIFFNARRFKHFRSETDKNTWVNTNS